jgi:hypothetical protein
MPERGGEGHRKQCQSVSGIHHELSWSLTFENGHGCPQWWMSRRADYQWQKGDSTMPQSAGQPGDLKFQVRWVLRERRSVLADEGRVRSKDQLAQTEGFLVTPVDTPDGPTTVDVSYYTPPNRPERHLDDEEYRLLLAGLIEPLTRAGLCAEQSQVGNVIVRLPPEPA